MFFFKAKIAYSKTRVTVHSIIRDIATETANASFLLLLNSFFRNQTATVIGFQSQSQCS